MRARRMRLTFEANAGPGGRPPDPRAVSVRNVSVTEWLGHAEAEAGGAEDERSSFAPQARIFRDQTGLVSPGDIGIYPCAYDIVTLRSVLAACMRPDRCDEEQTGRGECDRGIARCHERQGAVGHERRAGGFAAWMAATGMASNDQRATVPAAARRFPLVPDPLDAIPAVAAQIAKPNRVTNGAPGPEKVAIRMQRQKRKALMKASAARAGTSTSATSGRTGPTNDSTAKATIRPLDGCRAKS